MKLVVKQNDILNWHNLIAKQPLPVFSRFHFLYSIIILLSSVMSFNCIHIASCHIVASAMSVPTPPLHVVHLIRTVQIPKELNSRRRVTKLVKIFHKFPSN